MRANIVHVFAGTCGIYNNQGRHRCSASRHSIHSSVDAQLRTRRDLLSRCGRHSHKCRQWKQQTDREQCNNCRPRDQKLCVDCLIWRLNQDSSFHSGHRGPMLTSCLPACDAIASEHNECCLPQQSPCQADNLNPDRRLADSCVYCLSDHCHNLSHPCLHFSRCRLQRGQDRLVTDCRGRPWDNQLRSDRQLSKLQWIYCPGDLHFRRRHCMLSRPAWLRIASKQPHIHPE